MFLKKEILQLGSSFASTKEVKIEVLKDLYREIETGDEELLFFLIKLFFEKEDEEIKYLIRKIIFKALQIDIRDLSFEYFYKKLLFLSEKEKIYGAFTFVTPEKLNIFLKKNKIEELLSLYIKSAQNAATDLYSYIYAFFIWKIGSLFSISQQEELRKFALFLLELNNEYLKYVGMKILYFVATKKDIEIAFSVLSEATESFLLQEIFKFISYFDLNLAFLEIRKRFYKMPKSFWAEEGIEYLLSLVVWNKDILEFLLQNLDLKESSIKERLLEAIILKIDSQNAAVFMEILKNHPDLKDFPLDQLKVKVRKLWAVDNIQTGNITTDRSNNEYKRKDKSGEIAKNSFNHKVIAQRNFNNANTKTGFELILTSIEKMLGSESKLVLSLGTIMVILIFFAIFYTIFNSKSQKQLSIRQEEKEEKMVSNSSSVFKLSGEEGKIGKIFKVRGEIKKIYRTPRKRIVLEIKEGDSVKNVIFLERQLKKRKYREGEKVELEAVYSKTDALGWEWYYGK